MAGNLIFPTLIAFAVTAALGPLLIPVLRKFKVGQTEREELKSHIMKEGTPTMGGLMILAGILIAVLPYLGDCPKILPILLVTLGFGLIGFLDDALKVALHRSDGLLPWQKMLGQIIVTVAFLAYMYISHREDATTMLLPFTGGFEDGKYIDLGWLALPIMFLAILGTVNGANFTDGLDGLASSVTIPIAVFFAIASSAADGGIVPAAGAVIGALMGFLLFNVYPARIFMGDTGSLALGGFVVSAAYMMRMPMFIPIVALLYWVELLSVMIQVTYFRKTGGKRIFRMAPIHHHFELGGWSETRVTAVFSIITAILCLVGMLAL